jgi:hypothetical protein
MALLQWMTIQQKLVGAVFAATLPDVAARSATGGS